MDKPCKLQPLTQTLTWHLITLLYLGYVVDYLSFQSIKSIGCFFCQKWFNDFSLSHSLKFVSWVFGNFVCPTEFRSGNLSFLFFNICADLRIQTNSQDENILIQVKRAIFTILFLGLVYKLPYNAYFHWCVFFATKQVLQEDSDIITGIEISSARWLTAAD